MHQIGGEVAGMRSDKLWVSYDDDDGWVTLHKKTAFGDMRTSSFQLHEGFTVDHVREALLATGWVDQQGDGYVADSRVSCQDLCNTVEEMFPYFSGPGVPGEELVRIRDAVAEYYLAHDAAAVEIPLWAYAWLDLMVRDEIADEARRAEDIWSDSQLTVDVAKHCDRYVDEVVARYSQPAPSSRGTGKMAPSSRQRRETQAETRSKIG
jgi:hypothetical protein